LLTVSNTMLGTTHSIRGTTDLAFVEVEHHKNNMNRIDLHVMWELEKDAARAHCVRTFHLELIVAARMPNFALVVVLTDLCDDWRFYWLTTEGASL
jgi:hypothetical protein